MCIEPLEPRILFSAELVMLTTDDLMADPIATRALAIDPQALSQATDTANDDPRTTEFAANVEPTASPGRELVIIDSRVPQPESLIETLQNALPDRHFDILLVSEADSGLGQIAAFVEGHEPWDAWHLFSHASPGALQLGADSLSNDTLAEHSAQLSAWANNLTEHADILLYGCDLAATDQGLQFIDRLASLTGADVAASDDTTGAAALGGDFSLEVHTGRIEAAVALDAQAQASFAGTLAAYAIVADDTFSGNEDSAIADNVLTNDQPPDGSSLSTALTSDVGNGSLILNPDGTFIYTPDTNWNGTDSFEYVAIDAGAGPAHYWGLEGDGVDAVGTAHGTLMNGPTTVPGYDNDTLRFDGADDYVWLPDVNYASEFTIAFRFKIDDNVGSGIQYFYSHGAIAATNVVHVSFTEASYPTVAYRNSLITTFLDSNDSVAASDQIYTDISSLIGDGQWHFYTATVTTGVGTQVYVDGVLQGSDTTGTEGINPTGGAILGGRSDLDPTRFLRTANRIDSIEIYDSALSATEIGNLYANPLQATATLTVFPVNDAPTLTGIEAGAIAVTENDPAVAITPSLNVADVDSANLASATVSVSANYVNGEDILAFTDTANISGSWNAATGVLTLAGSDTVAAYQAALRSVTYQNLSDDPSLLTRTISFSVYDGALNANPITRNIAITAVNDAPVITSDGAAPTASLSGPENSTSVTTVSASDPDSGSLTFSISGGDDAPCSLSTPPPVSSPSSRRPTSKRPPT
ncbi:MAG: DUF4347 domain-containing protein [Burkholderiaceae bacterium]